MRSWRRNLCPKPAAVKDIQETPTKLADRGHARPRANDHCANDTERSSQPSARPAELPTELRCRDCRDSTVGRHPVARLADDHAVTGRPALVRRANVDCCKRPAGLSRPGCTVSECAGHEGSMLGGCQHRRRPATRCRPLAIRRPQPSTTCWTRLPASNSGYCLTTPSSSPGPCSNSVHNWLRTSKSSSRRAIAGPPALPIRSSSPPAM